MKYEENYSQFVADYIQKCIGSGVTSRNDIIDYVLEEIKTIQQEINKMHDGIVAKKQYKKKLQSVLTAQGYSAHQPKINEQKPFEEDSEEAKELRANICALLEEKGALTNREILDSLSGYQEDAKIYRSIKWLGEKEIIKRDGSPENRLEKGRNWENRPK